MGFLSLLHLPTKDHSSWEVGLSFRVLGPTTSSPTPTRLTDSDKATITGLGALPSLCALLTSSPHLQNSAFIKHTPGIFSPVSTTYFL